MATTASSASGSASRYSIDSSPWMADAIHDHPSPSDFFPSVSTPPAVDSSDLDNADKKPVWNKPSNSSAEVRPVMGAESWPALSLSSSSNKSPSFDSPKHSSSSMPMPQASGIPLNSNSNLNANAGSTAAAAAPSSDNHTISGQRKPFRRNNNNTSSSTSNPPTAPAATPTNTRDHYHNQRGGSYASGTAQFRNSHRNRNSSSYPRGDALHHGNKRNYEHGNQSGFPHPNFHGREMHLQPQRGLGIMRPQMLMGPPSFPATSAQYIPAPQLASHGGGPMLFPDYSPHVFMPHPPPEPMALLGHLPPPQMYFPSFDDMLYSKILTQVEYYFSADNLSRDEHLRSQMSDEGWVPVRVIAGFRRLAELTNNIQTVLEALRMSAVVEIKGETLRRRGDWDKYLLPREPSKSGPAAATSNNTSVGSQLERMTLSQRSRGGE